MIEVKLNDEPNQVTSSSSDFVNLVLIHVGVLFPTSCIAFRGHHGDGHISDRTMYKQVRGCGVFASAPFDMRV